MEKDNSFMSEFEIKKYFQQYENLKKVIGSREYSEKEKVKAKENMEALINNYKSDFLVVFHSPEELRESTFETFLLPDKNIQQLEVTANSEGKISNIESIEMCIELNLIGIIAHYQKKDNTDKKTKYYGTPIKYRSTHMDGMWPN